MQSSSYVSISLVPQQHKLFRSFLHALRRRQQILSLDRLQHSPPVPKQYLAQKRTLKVRMPVSTAMTWPFTQSRRIEQTLISAWRIAFFVVLLTGAARACGVWVYLHPCSGIAAIAGPGADIAAPVCELNQQLAFFRYRSWYRSGYSRIWSE